MGNGAHGPADLDTIIRSLAGHELVDLYPLVLFHHAQAGVVAIPHPDRHYTVSTAHFGINLDRVLTECPEAVTVVVYACGDRSPLDVWRELEEQTEPTMLCRIQILRPGGSRRLYLSSAEAMEDTMPNTTTVVDA